VVRNVAVAGHFSSYPAARVSGRSVYSSHDAGAGNLMFTASPYPRRAMDEPSREKGGEKKTAKRRKRLDSPTARLLEDSAAARLKHLFPAERLLKDSGPQLHAVNDPYQALLDELRAVKEQVDELRRVVRKLMRRRRIGRYR
jgi:hypothetical protein